MNTSFNAELQQARLEGPEALKSLAEKHLPLVGTLVHRFPAANIPKEELYQQGALGLMKALKRFDPARGTAFSTYAAAMILGEIRMLQRMEAPIHIPRTEQELRRRIRQHAQRLSAQLLREPTVTELAASLQIDAAELMLHLDDITVSSTDAERPDGTSIAAMLPDPENWQDRIELRDILSRLPEKDRTLILLRHRLGLTQAEVGKRIGMTQMQVSRREKMLRTLLRRALTD